ncbi:hypothetical protein K438DRAFT_1630194 [Mycena galopus ATCC 62051]|nr:hypothetical protein K438DRAFT_1630194 [Mycena galopus ATCC 62051]
MGWQKWLPGAKEAHLKSASEAHHESAAETLQRKEQEAESKRERERILGAERQRRFREKKRLEKEAEKDGHLSDDDNANVVLTRSADAAAAAHARHIDVPELSRAGTQSWRQGRNGTKGGAVQKRAATTNWFHPFVFGPIEEQMIRTDWSPSHTIKNLQRKNPAVYKSLAKGTISRWRVDGGEEVDRRHAGANQRWQSHHCFRSHRNSHTIPRDHRERQANTPRASNFWRHC